MQSPDLGIASSQLSGSSCGRSPPEVFIGRGLWLGPDLQIVSSVYIGEITDDDRDLERSSPGGDRGDLGEDRRQLRLCWFWIKNVAYSHLRVGIPPVHLN